MAFRCDNERSEEVKWICVMCGNNCPCILEDRNGEAKEESPPFECPWGDMNKSSWRKEDQ